MQLTTNVVEIENKLRKVFSASSRYSKGATFLGIYARDRLSVNIPDGPSLMVCNTKEHTHPGEHWIAMYFHPDDESAEYFDSFGEAPPPSFATYMLKHAKHIECNDKQIQSVVSMYCGHYIVLFCAFRSIRYGIRKFTTLFCSDFGLNDFLTLNLVCKLIVD